MIIMHDSGWLSHILDLEAQEYFALIELCLIYLIVSLALQKIITFGCSCRYVCREMCSNGVSQSLAFAISYQRVAIFGQPLSTWVILKEVGEVGSMTRPVGKVMLASSHVTRN